MISFSAPVITNATQQGGTQNEVKTVALANGGYVSAWNSFVGSNTEVVFQRFDALGNQVGGPTQFANGTGRSQCLQDIATTADGQFTILTQGEVGPLNADDRLFVQSFAGSTGAASAQLTLNLSAFGPNGTFSGQLLANPLATNELIVTAATIDINFELDLVRLSVLTSGLIAQAPLVVANNQPIPPGGISELIESVVPGAEFVLFDDGTGILGTSGTRLAVTGAGDIMALSAGTLVVASGAASVANVGLNLLTGIGANILQYVAGTVVPGTNVQGNTTAGAQTFAKELVDLGGGRLLIVFVADGGDTVINNGLTDGVYAQVYNINTGSIEGNATLILGQGQGNNDAALAAITISADLMQDGRVALGLSFINGLGGLDVFSSVLDARVAGVSLVATPASDIFVGSVFDDAFSGISGADIVIGGLGIDTVIFTGGTARTIDLDTAAAFPLSEIVLTGIENLTGGNGADDLRGNALVNRLTGGAGNDALQGRGGNDVLAGDAGEDLLRGDAQNDVLSGGNDNDQLFGGGDADLLFGGAGFDVVKGDAGDDTLNGDADDDRLSGGDGDDQLGGDAGDDILTGGAGNDALFGGIGNDSLLAEVGADSVFGGVGNDVIRAVTDVQQIDGGTGTDTLVIANVNFTPGTGGAHLDLTGDVELLGLVDDFTRMQADISGVENVTGSAGDDFIGGDAAANVLRCGNGDDFVFSRGGNDTLFGGLGADGFIFSTATGGADVISDFALGVDRIALVLGGFGDINAGNLVSRLTVSTTGAVAANATAQLMFDNSGPGAGRLFFDADGNGAGAAVVLATLSFTTATGLAGFDATAFDFI